MSDKQFLCGPQLTCTHIIGSNDTAEYLLSLASLMIVSFALDEDTYMLLLDLLFLLDRLLFGNFMFK